MKAFTSRASSHLLWTVAVAVMGVSLVSGCTTDRYAPPLFTSAPVQEPLPEPSVLAVPAPPAAVSMPLTIRIPQKQVSVGRENSIMRQGAAIRPGSSVVISVPASIYQRSQEMSRAAVSDQLGFRTDGYFNVLEQYIERGLIASGFHVKDRAKFEAKLRDLRDSGEIVRRADSSYNIALGDLQKELDAGRITREQFAAEAMRLRDRLLDPSRTSESREELTDISEVIRAAQDGDVMADYVLQVNELAVVPFTGSPLQLGVRPEVQEVLRENEGLGLGPQAGHDTLPASLKQPWLQARFNAKLIDVKTGSIDWIGEYSLESLAVLEDGFEIIVGIRKRPTNAGAVRRDVEAYNRTVRMAYDRALQAKRALDAVYEEAMGEKAYYGTPGDVDAIQAGRRREVQLAESLYANALEAYRAVLQAPPPTLGLRWTFEYDVDDPVVNPNLFRPRNEGEEARQLLQHIKDLGSKVTYDLLSTISVK